MLCTNGTFPLFAEPSPRPPGPPRSPTAPLSYNPTGPSVQSPSGPQADLAPAKSAPAANAEWALRFPSMFEITDGTLGTAAPDGPGLGF